MRFLELSNLACLPGRAGGSPFFTSRVGNGTECSALSTYLVARCIVLLISEKIIYILTLGLDASVYLCGWDMFGSH